MNSSYTDEGGGQPIVWIHGFPHSSRVFQRQLSITGVRHIVPDLPGFGRTPPASIGSIDDYARAVLALLDRLGIDRAIFAGLSMGGYICFGIPLSRVEGLILIDTRETADTPEARKGRYETIEKVKVRGVSVVVDSLLPKMLTPAAPPELVDEVRTMMSGSSREGVIAALRAMAERPDSTPILPRINVPVLIAVGDQDSVTPPSDAERMAKAIKKATLVTIRGAAHLSNLEKPQEFNAAVERFL
jgi:3-oxoadipate enol-lactonase